MLCTLQLTAIRTSPKSLAYKNISGIGCPFKLSAQALVIVPTRCTDLYSALFNATPSFSPWHILWHCPPFHPLPSEDLLCLMNASDSRLGCFLQDSLHLHPFSWSPPSKSHITYKACVQSTDSYLLRGNTVFSSPVPVTPRRLRCNIWGEFL